MFNDPSKTCTVQHSNDVNLHGRICVPKRFQSDRYSILELNTGTIFLSAFGAVKSMNCLYSSLRISHPVRRIRPGAHDDGRRLRKLRRQQLPGEIRRCQIEQHELSSPPRKLQQRLRTRTAQAISTPFSHSTSEIYISSVHTSIRLTAAPILFLAQSLTQSCIRSDKSRLIGRKRYKAWFCPGGLAQCFNLSVLHRNFGRFRRL